MATLRTATDDILGLFAAAWAAGAPAIAGSLPPVVYPHEDDGSIPSTSGAWARVSIQHQAGEQQTIGGPGNRLFEHSGKVFVQVFAPMKGKTGFDLAQQLAEVALGAFQGQSTRAVWFRNVGFQEIGPDGPFFQINITADFLWSQAI